MAGTRKCRSLGFKITWLFLMLGFATSALAAAPAWLPSFPMRAGAMVLVMWLPVPGAGEYKVLRKVEGEGDFKEVYKGAVPSYSDAAAGDMTKTYVYKIVPVTGGKDGDASAEGIIKGQEKIKAPEFSGNLTTPEGIQLRWTLVNGSVFYNLYRSATKDGEYSLLTSIQQNSYFDKAVKPGNTYYYKITAVDKNSLESEKSKVAEVVLEAAKAVVAKKPVTVKKIKKLYAAMGEDLYELDRPGSAALIGKELFVSEPTGIQVLDADSNGKYIRRIKFPEGWTEPFGMRKTPSGDLSICFSYESLVRIISPADGKELKSFKVNLAKDAKEGTKITRPGSAFVAPDGNLWVSDSSGQQIVIFNPNGDEIERIGTLPEKWRALPDKDRPADAFPGLGGISYDAKSGKVFAILSVDAKIKVIDFKTHKVEKTWGGLGSDVDQFSGLAAVEFRKDGNALMFDNLNSYVKEFNSALEYQHTFADEFDPKSNKALLTATGSAFMLLDEAANRLFVVSKLQAKVFAFELVK